jgi:hypothetical protein
MKITTTFLLLVAIHFGACTQSMALFGTPSFLYNVAIIGSKTPSATGASSENMGGVELTGGFTSDFGLEVDYILSAGPGHFSPINVGTGPPSMQVSINGQSSASYEVVIADAVAEYGADWDPNPPGVTSHGVIQNVSLVASGYVADGDTVSVLLRGRGSLLGQDAVSPDTLTIGYFYGGPFSLSHNRTIAGGSGGSTWAEYRISVEITRSGSSTGTTNVGVSSVGISQIAQLPGDFDADGDVDGRDFLAWQRDSSIGDLADWQANYGVGSMSAFNGGGTPPANAVPEPGSLMLLGALIVLIPARLRCAASRG